MNNIVLQSKVTYKLEFIFKIYFKYLNLREIVLNIIKYLPYNFRLSIQFYKMINELKIAQNFTMLS